MALGRGLGDILLEVEEAYDKDLSDIETLELKHSGARVEELELTTITPNPFQPRKEFNQESLQELSQSIQEHGLLQPIVVVSKDDGYLLVAGERRLRAHKLASMNTIKAIIVDIEIEETKLRELALIENIQRENLNPIDLANSYIELINVHNITHDDLSSIVHKSRSQITNTMRLLQLSKYGQDHIINGKISQGHAKVLVGLDEKKQKIVIDSIVGQKLSVRDTESLVKRYKNSKTIPSNEVIKPKTLLEDYVEAISTTIPFKHKVKSNSIEITFNNELEIEAFLEQLQLTSKKKSNTIFERFLN